MEITKDLENIINESVIDLANLMYAYMSFQFGETIKVSNAYVEGKKGANIFDNVTKNNTKHLRYRTGALLNSFFKKKNLKYNKGVISGDLSSNLPYAQIHETGGFIKSKTKFSMYGGLMKMYFKTGDVAYKFMALSVLKKGGVNIPARPYFYPFIKEFNETGLPDWWFEVEKRINEYINSVVFNV